MAGLVVQPPTVYVPPSVVVTTNLGELAPHGMLALESKPISVRDMPMTFWITAPAQSPVGAEALVASTRPRLVGSVVLSGEAPILATQAAARAPECVGSYMYG